MAEFSTHAPPTPPDASTAAATAAPESAGSLSALEQLSPRRRRFVLAYLAGDEHGRHRFVGTWAARQAGYAKPGPEATRLLKNANVLAAINEELSARALPHGAVLALLADDATRSDDEIIAIAQHAADRAGIPAGAAAISALVSARTTARTNLAKAHGLFTENLNVSGSLTREYVIVREGD